VRSKRLPIQDLCIGLFTNLGVTEYSLESPTSHFSFQPIHQEEKKLAGKQLNLVDNEETRQLNSFQWIPALTDYGTNSASTNLDSLRFCTELSTVIVFLLFMDLEVKNRYTLSYSNMYM